MQHINIEIKARCDRLDAIRSILQSNDAEFVGEDHQIDTYFRGASGRLKLREGTIEHALIHYERPDQDGPKPSDVTRYAPEPDPALKEVLTNALGVEVVVDKRREIYFINNVKFHLDRVDRLGTFVEIEAIGEDAAADPEALRAQCAHYMKEFSIREDELVSASYSDLVLRVEEA